MPTTNMSLNEPSVGTTAGPTWATEVNENFTTIDQHDHTSGKGVQLTPSALNINSDLEFNGNAGIELKRLTFDSSATGSGTNYSIYQSGGNLYWYNGSGQAVQITNADVVKTTGGSIDGMTGTDAQVLYGSGIYRFEFDSTKTPFAGAKMAHGDILLYKYDGSSGSNAYVILKYTGSSEGSNNITVPDETGTMLTTSTSYGGNISIAATGGSNTITLDAEGDINLDSNSGVLTFKDNGTAIGKISNSSSDLVIENEVEAKDIIFKQYDGNEVVRMAYDRRLYFYDKGGEYIYGDGTDLNINSGTAINLNAGVLDLSAQTVDVTLNAAVDALNFDSNTLSIDASNNRVGIGNSAPEADLHIGSYQSGSGTTATLRLSEGNGSGGSTGFDIKYVGSSDELIFTSKDGSGSFANRMTIDRDNGNVVIPGNLNPGSGPANFVGMIAPFAMSSVPTGWLACDGSAVSKTTYSALFAALGANAWGTDTTDDFYLPDLRGAFLRGTGSNATHNMADGNDYAGPSVGSFESDQNQSHTHTLSEGPGGGSANTYDGMVGTSGTTMTTAASGGDEARPFNAGVKYCIKY